MAKLLDQTLQEVRKLRVVDQDDLAEFLLDMPVRREEAGGYQPKDLDKETRAAIREGLEQIERGEFAGDEEMEAFFARHGA